MEQWEGAGRVKRVYNEGMRKPLFPLHTQLQQDVKGIGTVLCYQLCMGDWVIPRFISAKTSFPKKML